MRSAAVAVENNFIKGLITEFSALNAAENSCSEAYDCVFDITGVVERRLGLDFESAFSLKTINRTSNVVKVWLWKNVKNDGTVSLLVVQAGSTLYFYDATASSISAGALATTVDLTTYSPSGAPTPNTNECDFAAGNGLLFVFHPNLEPFYVSYDSSAQTVSGTQLTLQIRDFDGVNDTLAIDNRPTSLSDAHRYNLCNQGWTASYGYSSSTSLAIGTGSKTFTIATGLTTISAGDALIAISTADATNYMQGTVTSYTSGTGALVMNITSTGGSGSKTDWAIAHQAPNISVFFSQLGTYPSNSDIWWTFKNSSDIFAPKDTDIRVSRTNQRAPRGHYLLNPFSQQRDTASGLTITDVTTSYQRPATGAFFAGRVFFAGVNYSGYGGYIYFSQIALQEVARYANCYQKSDPTSEDTFDLLPDDGGVINIPEAGTIIKLFPVLNSLLVFATNGVWAISGSTGVGFTATDYTVSKISSVFPASATSFVDVQGLPFFWGNEDIYQVKIDPQQGGLTVVPLTHQTIHTFFNEIPLSCKQNARGAYNKSTFEIQWLYRSTEAGDPTDDYEFDRILVHNTLTGSWVPWRLPPHDVSVNSIFVNETSSGTSEEITVVSNAAETIVDDAGDTVISYEVTAGAREATFKYFVSYDNGASSYSTTWAEERNEDYLDWYAYDSTGTDFESTFTCGPKVHSQGQRQFQSNYLFVYLDNSSVNKADVQGVWNYASSGNTTKITTAQRLTTDGLNFSFVKKRRTIPGSGVALQYKFTSVSGYPMTIHGWSAYETGNSQP